MSMRVSHKGAMPQRVRNSHSRAELGGRGGACSLSNFENVNSIAEEKAKRGGGIGECISTGERAFVYNRRLGLM